jgi:leucyl-tRNA synthetase
VFTGAYAVNPLSAEAIPIWIADYVLASYGTGAIMAVPAHDERDFQFAKQFRLPIRPVVLPPSSHLDRHNTDLFSECYVGEGTAINSGSFEGLPTAVFKEKITAWLEELKKGQRKVNYKLRDWLFSRQRYWGEPFPILHEVDERGRPTGIVEPLPVSELPLCLPELEDYRPTGKAAPPLEKAKDWLKVSQGGKHYVRETNTMPQWAGSCWYYLRYIDPRNDQAFCDRAKQQYWLPVDLYVGGAEHAVLHLLYARFWHKVLYDRGHVATPEPFQRLVNQGMILGESVACVYTDLKTRERISAAALRKVKEYEVSHEEISEDEVEQRDSKEFIKGTDIEIFRRAEKMSKSRGNVINPDVVVDSFGADSLRLYEMFMGPLEATKPWSMRGVEGVYRFLGRVWRLAIDDRSEDMKLLAAVQDVEPEKETRRFLHQTIKRVTEDLDKLSFNTAIAAMMEFTNHLTPQPVRPRSVLKTFTLLLSPFAPHLAEELWRALNRRHGGTPPETLAYEPWPAYEEALLKADTVEIPVQINGKLRAKLTVPADTDKGTLEKLALADEKVRALIEGKTIKKVIALPGKLVNIVVG